MTEKDKPDAGRSGVTNEPRRDFGPAGPGGSTPTRTGRGMGVETGDYTEAKGTSRGANESDVPPTPHDDKGKRPLRGK